MDHSCSVFSGLFKNRDWWHMMLVIPIVASVFGGKESTGIILPMLLVGDVFAVKYYKRSSC